MDHARRLESFRRRMERDGLGACWVVHEPNVRYLTGFTGQDSTLLVTGGRALLVTDSRYEEQAEREAAVDEVVSRHVAMAKAVGVLCRRLGVRRVAVTASHLSHADFESLAQTDGLEVVPRRRGIVERMRARKDADEVAAIRAAIAVAQDSFRATVSALEPGQTERRAATRLEYEMRARGAQKAAFDIICAAGPTASVPHAVSGDAPIGPDDAVLIDWGARLDGYCCDLTRVVTTGRIPDKISALIEVVLEAQDAVLGALRPGAQCAEADAAGRAVIARAGQGRRFGHGMGHGVGLQVHEAPHLGPGAEGMLLPGMVVTVEPGIYVPGEGGVRVEEMALITDDGHQVLTSLPRRPDQIAVLDA